VNERDDNDVIDAHSIDETIFANEQLAILSTPQLRDTAAAIGQGRQRLRGFQKIGYEPGGSGRRFVSQPSTDVFKQQGGARRPPYSPSHFPSRAFTSS
jgi:hypothetical protein